MKILGAVFELPAKQRCQSSPNWECCFAVSSKTAPRTLIFSIALCADYLFHMKSIATFTLIFFGYIISVYAIVKDLMCNYVLWVIVLR